MMSLRFVFLRIGNKATVWGRKNKALHFLCCFLKVIEFLIDFPQFYFKFIKPGRIA